MMSLGALFSQKAEKPMRGDDPTADNVDIQEKNEGDG
jgi:hypothetical protein